MKSCLLIRLGQLGLFLCLSLLPGYVRAQAVSGRVADESGQPLEGARIVVKNKPVGVFSQANGTFSITCAPADTLICTYLGYEPASQPVGGRTQVDFVLREAVTTLEDVVVVGYGVQRKSDLTGAIGSVKGEELRKLPSASVDQALQGKLAGVQVVPVSGEPGAAAVIRIRGIGTLNDAAPLFVVDGMLLDDIQFLNPADVASVEVLKDASATAIYGSRGANGVIIITTSQGKAGQARVEVSSFMGTQELAHKISLTSARDFAILANELAENEGIGQPFADPDQITGGTDWQEVIFRPAPMSQVQVSASGGSAAMRYHISGNWLRQAGILEGSDYSRATLRANNQYDVKPWLTLGHNVTLMYIQRDIAAGVLDNAYRADPTVPERDSTGAFGNTSLRASVANPAAQIFYNNNSGFSYRAVGNVFMDLRLLKYLTFRTSAGIDLENNQSKNFVPEYYVSPIQQNLENQLYLGFDRNLSWLWENTLTFDRAWDRHRLNVLTGLTAQQFRYEQFGGSRRGLPGETPELWYLGAGQVDGQTNYHDAYEWRMLSYLFRTNYTYQDRYLMTVSLRADGSSKFGANNRYGYFPSVALGWNVTREAFMASQQVFSRLKVRASWGIVGNEKIGAYASQAVVSSNLNGVFGYNPALSFGASIITLANPDLRWESTRQADIGLEMGFAQDRLSLEADYYDRLTDGILIGVPIPDYVGSANNPIENAAQVRNTGLDLKLDWRSMAGPLSYRIGLIGATVSNEVVSLGEGKEEIFGGDLGFGGNLGTRTAPGLPIGSFYGYKVAGIYQNQADLEQYPNAGTEQPGDLRFEDVDGDGVISTADRTYLGSPIPNFIYGLSTGLEIAGIDLSVDLNGQSGNKLVNAKKMARFGTYNFETSYLDRWTGEGTSDTEPRVTNGGPNYSPSERFLEDGSFLRLRLVQIGYTLPASLTTRAGLSRVRLYASGANLVTWTRYTGYTPEVTSNSVISVGIDRGVYPIARTYTGGLDISF
ncbi:MAG: TonB-dependent receptor [Bacteroidia bacterium]|nr:TonB-dependent receptor [Bacteroidia bacterium]